MTRIKLCGLSRHDDIEAANALMPTYIGFVFAPKSRRFVTFEQAEALKQRLNKAIRVVGVFVNEKNDTVATLLNSGVIDMAQLHGEESEETLYALKKLTDKPLIKAFRIQNEASLSAANRSVADYVLLDSGAGTGTPFDWRLLTRMERPYFLAGGLDSTCVGAAVQQFKPFAVDVSSGIETDGVKDKRKMAAFVAAVRKAGQS